MADLLLDVQSAPTTPSAGQAVVYVDTSLKRLSTKDDAGTVVNYTSLATPVTVPNGGTAATTLTGILQGNGTSAVTAIAVPSDATKFLDGTGAFSVPATGGTIDNAVNDFRLSLTTAVPVTVTDVTGATTVYACQYGGNRIALYDGAAWNIRTSAEFSLALGTLTSGLPYDVFCYDNSGTPTLEFLAWTNGTTRATALALQDGVLSKTGALTRRYLGTFYTTSTTATEDSAAKRFLWNHHHQKPRSMRVLESTASWTYNSATFRQINASTANQLAFIIGLSENVVHTQVLETGSLASGALICAIGEDSTSTPSTNGLYTRVDGNGSGLSGMSAVLDVAPAIGYHYLAALESSPSGNATFYGTNGGTNMKTGISGFITN